MGFRSEKRGVTEAVSVSLQLAVLLLVITSLASIMNGYFEAQTDITRNETLEMQGQQVSRTIGVVDRLVRTSDSDGEIGQTLSLSREVSGQVYYARIINSSDAGSGAICSQSCILLYTGGMDQRVPVRYTSETEVNSTRVQGGSLYIYRPNDREHIRVEVTDS